MGLLDDAIREHLELKRRHGADPTEVARQESEALGPARRAAERQTVAEPESEEHDLDAAPGEEPEAEAEAEAPEPPQVVEFGPLSVQPSEPEPEPEPEPELEPKPRRVEPELIDQPTVEHSSAKPEPLAEDEPPPPAFSSEDEDADVLEGTPEFLEETPEHDRLWFEQRPPRDFDFDD
jgi:hypothetical protein